MAYDNLKTRVAAVIKENGNREITGDLLQGVLLDIISVLGTGYQFVGVATPTTIPGMPDAKVFYLAFEPGTYPNFGGAVLASGIGVFSFDSEWHYASINLPSRSDIETAFDGKMSAVTANAEIALKADSVTPVVPPMVAGSARGILGRSAAARFLYRQTTSGSGAAWLKKIAGRTVSVNQLVLNGDFADGKTGWNGTGSVTNGIYTVTWPAQYSNNGIYQYNRQVRTIIGHKYYVRAWIQNLEEQARSFYLGIPYVTSDRVARTYAANEASVMSGVYTATSASTADGSGNAFKLYSSVGSDASIKTTGIMVIDLTQAGLDYMTTPEQFEEWQMEQFGNKDYIAYTPGKLVSVNPTGVKTTGRNVWDEELEEGILNVDGTVSPASGRYCSKNYIPCGLASKYYFYIEGGANFNTICYYDANFALVGYEQARKGERTIPSGAVWAKFGLYSSYGGGRICINISDPAFNGQYEPYNGHTLPLDFTEHFPAGMNGVNDVVDEVESDEFGKFTEGDVRFGIVDLGTPIWNALDAPNGRFFADIPAAKGSDSSVPSCICGLYRYVYMNYSESADMTLQLRTNHRIYVRNSAYTSAAAFAAAMSGVPLIYELATPQHVTFTDPSDAVYPVTEGGTEQVLPVNGSDPETIAPDMTLQMPRVLGKDTPAMGSLDNLVAAVAQKVGKTITKVWDNETRSYQFEIQ